MSKERKKLILIDGHSLLHRAFYALPTLTNAQGEFTNAVYGFTMMLMRLLEDENPDHIAVAFDFPAPTFRHEAYEEYKANRMKMPDQLRPQVPLVKEVVTAFGIPIFEKEGFEADDIIGTLARQGAENGCEVLIVTGDRDCLQLVGTHIKAMITRRGIKDMEIFDAQAVKDKLGVSPDQVVDYKGLVGDSSDNIPGVPGIGKKTAIRLLNEYPSVEEILSDLDNVKGRARKSLSEHRDQALLSKELATIDTNVPVSLDLLEYKRENWDQDRLRQLFTRLEFRSLLEKLEATRPVMTQGTLDLGGSADDSRQTPALDEPTICDSREQLEGLIRQIDEDGVLIVKPLTAGPARTGRLAGLGVATSSGISYIPVYHQKAILPEEEVVASFEERFARMEIVGHDLKELCLWLLRHGIQPRKLQFDVAIASYLLNPQGNHAISDVAMKLYNEYIPSWDEVLGKGAKAVKPTEIEVEAAASQVARELAFVQRRYKELKKRLQEEKMEELFSGIEMPLIEVLARMEATGIKVDPTTLAKLDDEFGSQIEELTREIYRQAGTEFNINSPKQLREILFTRLQLPVLKKTKTGPSTSADVLEQLADEHEIVSRILEYRQLVKLKTTYVDALTHLIDEETGRVHTTFNQTVTATGRLSSTNPNLQNIPIRTEEGRRIRAAFVAGEEGWQVMAADYSQIELRVLAHISQDKRLIEAFSSGQDIHARTAAEVFGVPLEDVTSQMRSAAKAINFGIVYGISSYGLARGANLSRKEAQQYIDEYFERYPGVKEYLDGVIKQARKDGYVTTLFNRKRYLPDLYSRNWATRSFAERTAMNTPIQGSAADIIKLAMVAVARELEKGGFRTRMLLQVHDELVFEVPPEEVQEIAALVRETMEGVMDLAVPLVAEVELGSNWMEAK